MVTAAKDTQVSVRLPSELNDTVASYSALTGRTKSHVVMEALAEYMTWRVPQSADLKEALAAADRGEFAEDSEIDAVFAKLGAAESGAPSSPARPRKSTRRSA